MAPQPRVASLLPSATEMLCAIGGEHLLVGRSHEDDFPASIADMPVLTATKLPGGLNSAEIDAAVSAAVRGGDELYAVLVEELRRVRPTVILTQDLCNVCSVSPPDVSAAIAGLEPAPVVLSFNPKSLNDVLEDMLRLGSSLGLVDRAREVVAALRARVAAVAEAAAAQPQERRPAVAFLEWADPVFVGGHWTPELVEIAGGRHVLNAAGKKSFRVSREDVASADPDAVLLCPCGLTLEQALGEARSERCEWLRGLRAVREGRAGCADGNAMFNRPGPRLVGALEWLAAWLHASAASGPAASPLPDFPWSPWPEADPRPAKRLRDVEDFASVHAEAVCRGETSYNDPSTGYSVFSELYMLRRGYCCGSGCRHCPFGHFNVKGRTRLNRIAAPRLVGPVGASGRGTGPLVAWAGPGTEAPPGATVCLLFDSEAYAAVTEDRTAVGEVMDWVQERQLELLAVPSGRLQEALRLVRPAEWRFGGRALGGEEEWTLAVGGAGP